MDLTYWFLATMVVVGAAYVQASVGIGFAMLAAPLLYLLDPRLVPGPVLIAMLGLALVMSIRGRKYVDHRGLVAILPGLLGGTVLAVVMLPWVPDVQGQITGATVLVAALLAVVGVTIPNTVLARLVLGVFAGATGTLSGIHGPALAVAYGRVPRRVARSTIAVVFVPASVVSLAALWATQDIARDQWGAGLVLVPGALIGWALARIDWLRPPDRVAAQIALGLAGASGLVLLVSG